MRTMILATLLAPLAVPSFAGDTRGEDNTHIDVFPIRVDPASGFDGISKGGEMRTVGILLHVVPGRLQHPRGCAGAAPI